MKTSYLLFIAALLLFTMCEQKPTKQSNELTEEQKFELPPDWAKDVIWYQIFVERFYNGDSSNDPTPETMYASTNWRQTPDDWSITPWNWNWYKQEEWTKDLDTDFYGGLGLRRFGGDLQGVMDKLDYLEDLGITAIYFNPLNDAPSLHKFDARNYHHIDVTFGPDPEGDRKIMASEDPNDPSTWKWTSADKMFLKLVDELHQRGIRVVVDFSWNHTGVEFWAWKDIVENQGNSKYKEFYAINEFDDPATAENEFEYEGWLDLSSLPEIKKVNLKTERKIGHPYEGDINPIAKKHIFDVTKRWLAPDGDVTKGIDGYRMDVADHIGMEFWRDWRKEVRSINPEAYIVGEIWWEEWPDKLMNPVPYVSGDVFDAVMFYQVYRPARYFFGRMDDQITAEEFKDSLEFQWNRLNPETIKAMMNTAATHDAPRLLTSFANPSNYKYQAKPNDNPDYVTWMPDEETFNRVKMYLVHQFTSLGAPQVWNGDEMGMTGGDDPDCRKPLWWSEFEFEPEYKNNLAEGEKTFYDVGFNQEHFDFYKKVIQLRKDNPVLVDGDFEFFVADGKKLAYKRKNDTDEIFVMFNTADDVSAEFPLPPEEKFIDLWTGENAPNFISLPALSFGIYKRINQ